MRVTLIVSLKPDQDLPETSRSPFAIVNPTLANYLVLFQDTAFLRWTLNTFVVTIAATALSLACSVLLG